MQINVCIMEKASKIDAAPAPVESGAGYARLRTR